MSVFGNNPVSLSRAARRVTATARTAMVTLAGATIVVAAVAVVLGR